MIQKEFTDKYQRYYSDCGNQLIMDGVIIDGDIILPLDYSGDIIEGEHKIGYVEPDGELIEDVVEDTKPKIALPPKHYVKYSGNIIN